ncbi:MAG: class I SAM-dependent methyltransferase [Nitrospirae bacterium]|nr:class I SAM-dependent methyltransferase [Nitrospirota bacterium]
MSEDEAVYLQGLVRQEGFKGKHLEIGTAAGGTLCLLMKVFETGKRPPFIVVDSMNYFPNQYEAVQKNLKNNGITLADVEFRIKSSREAFAEAYRAGEMFDFILIDASHKIHRVTEDLMWTRLLSKGGIVCLHDYRYIKGVTLAVKRFLRKNPHFEVIDCIQTLIALRKSRLSSKPEINLTDRLRATALAPLLQLENSLTKRLSRKK